jgi:serine/threonine protein kinase
MPIDDITPEELAKEFAIAKTYFAQHLEVEKLSRHESRHLTGRLLTHSFLNVDHELYVMSNKLQGYGGEGSFGKYKQVQDEAGHDLGIKIEGQIEEDERENRLNDAQIQKSLGRTPPKLITIKFDRPKKWRKGTPTREGELVPGVKQVKEKNYIIMQNIKGTELGRRLQSPKKHEQPFTEAEKLLIALHTADALQDLHNQKILHNDVKAKNFIIDMPTPNADLPNGRITITPIDFGFGMRGVADVNKYTLKRQMGTPGYIAPEAEAGQFSAATDTFSFAAMLEKDLDLHSPVIANGHIVWDEDDPNWEEHYTYDQKLNTVVPKDRPTLEDLKKDLIAQLQAQPQSELEKYAADPYVKNARIDRPASPKSGSNSEQAAGPSPSNSAVPSRAHTPASPVRSGSSFDSPEGPEVKGGPDAHSSIPKPDVLPGKGHAKKVTHKFESQLKAQALGRELRATKDAIAKSPSHSVRKIKPPGKKK